MSHDCIYLDYQSGTPLDRRVLELMLPYMTEFYGNPSSPHAMGRQASRAVDTARRQFRDLIGAKYSNEIIFVSGATEANRIAMFGLANALRTQGDHIVTTAIEHKAVLLNCQALAEAGFQVSFVPVGRDGIVEPRDIDAAITPRTILISVMHANNEIGTVQSISEIADIARRHDVLLHTDAAQSVGSLPFDVDALGVASASFSGHKIYGPKGVGALYLRRGSARPVPQILGGEQEYGLRAGTLNVPGIIGLGAAAEILAAQRDTDSWRIADLREYLLNRLYAEFPEAWLNGSLVSRLPGNINITIPGLDADRLVRELPGAAISTGSACNAGFAEPSHVLTAIGLDNQAARSTLRISIGRPTEAADVDRFIPRLVAQVRATMSSL